MTATTLLFVYGTLKLGHRNHGLMRGQRLVREAETARKYRLYDLGSHPGMVRDQATGVAVHGEVWEVTADALAKLDKFEEVPDLFVRTLVEVPGLENVNAYFWNGSVPQGVETGSEWPFPANG